MKKNLVLIILVGVFIILLIVFIILVRTNKISFQAAGGTATLTLNPSTSTVTTGSTFNVAIVLNTGGQSSAGADARLNYNPQDLEVQDFNSGTSGIQIQPGTNVGPLFSQTTWNSVDPATGKINFSGVINSGAAGYNGTGTLATITFKALRVASSSSVTFDYTDGSENDSNVWLKTTGTDVTDLLLSVGTGSYNLIPPSVPTTVRFQLQGRSGKADTTNTTFEIRNVGQVPLVFQKNDLTTDATGNGSLTITSVPTGNYDFKIKVSNYLTKTLPNTSLNAPLTLDFGTLLGGDLNNDNIVNVLDFTYLVSKWNTADTIADITKSGQVNGGDFVVIDSNWLKQGN